MNDFVYMHKQSKKWVAALFSFNKSLVLPGCYRERTGGFRDHYGCQGVKGHFVCAIGKQ